MFVFIPLNRHNLLDTFFPTDFCISPIRRIKCAGEFRPLHSQSVVYITKQFEIYNINKYAKTQEKKNIYTLIVFFSYLALGSQNVRTQARL